MKGVLIGTSIFSGVANRIRSIYHFIIIIIMLSNTINGQAKTSTIQTQVIKTSIGNIACYIQEVDGTIPIIFLHGVYYDHNLWNNQTSQITDRTVIMIDMPLHGKSKEGIKPKWNMQNCVEMLIDILDTLNVEKCYAIGHSWGSMTILRAASQHPQRFMALGLCNMPLKAGNFGAQLKFGFQHLMLGARKFYTKQAAKVMFSKESLSNNPKLLVYLQSSMNQLTNQEVKQTDKAAITGVKSGQPYLENLKVPALALKGEEDYVAIPKGILTAIVQGKHTSPLEQPQEVMNMILKVLELGIK